MKAISRKYLIFFLILLSAEKIYSQDSTKYFIGYGIFKGIINEQSLTFGYQITHRHFLTISLGYTHDNKILREEFLDISPSQDKYPFLVYYGPTFRTSYGFRLAPRFYVGADLFYKYLYYNNHTFHDSKGDPSNVYFTRDEKSNVFGWHINTGFLIIIPKIRLLINPTLGIGETYKHRNYTTTYSKTIGEPSFDIPLGSFKKNLHYISLMMNLNVGITIGK